MARVTEIEKARKDQPDCGRCGDPIPKGTPYRWATPGFRASKVVRCMKPECRFRPSELTTSKMSQVYAAQESAHEALDALDGTLFEDTDEVASVLQSCADDAREVADEYTEAADAMGAAGEELQERAEIIEGWCDDLEGASFEDSPVADPDEEFEELDAAEMDDELQSWRESVLEEARSLIDGLEL